jgi:hypothetical protein
VVGTRSRALACDVEACCEASSKPGESFDTAAGVGETTPDTR